MIKTGFDKNSYMTERRDGILAKLALVALFLFIFLVPWGDSVFFSLPRYVGIFLFGIVALVFLTQGLHTQFGIFHFIALAYASWLLISLMWSPHYEAGLEAVITMLQLILLTVVMTFLIDNKKKIILAYQSYVIGCVISTSILLFNFISGVVSPDHYKRFVIANLEIDTLSVVLAISIPMAAYLVTQTNNKLLKIFNVIAIPVIMYGIFLTGTRTGFIIGMLGVLYWLFTNRKASITIKSLIIIVSLASVVAILSFAPKFSVDRILSAGKSISSGTLNYRTVIWKGTINQWKQSPVIGSGIGGLGYGLSQEYIDYDAAHNAYLHLLAENGIIGLTLYLLILITLFYYLLQVPFNERVFLFTLFVALVVSQLSLHIHKEKMVWIAYTLILIHSHFSKKTNRSN